MLPALLLAVADYLLVSCSAYTPDRAAAGDLKTDDPQSRSAHSLQPRRVRLKPLLPSPWPHTADCREDLVFSGTFCKPGSVGRDYFVLCLPDLPAPDRRRSNFARDRELGRQRTVARSELPPEELRRYEQCPHGYYCRSGRGRGGQWGYAGAGTRMTPRIDCVPWYMHPIEVKRRGRQRKRDGGGGASSSAAAPDKPASASSEYNKYYDFWAHDQQQSAEDRPVEQDRSAWGGDIGLGTVP